MVNVGGPSKGCLTCIKRKIRCDREQPVCGQCRKSSRECGGYRDATDLIFRNQSQAAYVRVAVTTLSRLKKREDTEDGEGSDSSSTNFTLSTSKLPILIRSPKLKEESGLIAFFANNFVCSDSNSGTNLFWVPNNFNSLLENDITKCSVQSVGAMALARLRRSNYYFREAQKLYGLVLRSLAETWRQSVEIDKDAILIAIMFLGFFEILASDLSSSRQSWMAHLGGLGLLLTRRKPHFANTALGARMLLQSRSQVILNALQTKTPVTEEFRTLSQGFQRSMPPQALHFDLADMLLIRLATLQAQFQSLGPSNTLIVELIALDTDIHHWTEAISTSWSFTSQQREPPSELWWELRCDLYPTPLIAHVRNKMRAAQLVIYDLIQGIHQQGGNPLNLAVPSKSSATVKQALVTDICATIPSYYLPSSAVAYPGSVDSLPQLGTTYWLFWPLEIVGSTSNAPLELMGWVKQCFERVYETTGIVKAKVAAERLQERLGQIGVT